jgi:hypothetical protein
MARKKLGKATLINQRSHNIKLISSKAPNGAFVIYSIATFLLKPLLSVVFSAASLRITNKKES